MIQYDVIYADPPWTYKDKAQAGKRGVGFKYKTLTKAALKALPVQKLAKPDCVLFLWATMPLLPDVLEVMQSWGFTYKTTAFVWVKTVKDTQFGFSLAWGMGNWTRANVEVVLMGTRGKPKRADAGVHQVVLSPREKPHSRKPAEVRDRIDVLTGPGDKIELFATEVVPGWTPVGFDANGMDVRDLLGVEP